MINAKGANLIDWYLKMIIDYPIFFLKKRISWAGSFQIARYQRKSVRLSDFAPVTEAGEKNG
jgi:hypothetical protein